MTNVAEAFVYCWTDHLTNRLYVGSHKGRQDDGYICSSRLMLEQYNKRPHDFTRQIIATGDFTAIRNLEYLILESADAKRDKTFYNQHNGNGNFYLKGHTQETIDRIQKSCKRPDGTDKRARSGEENGMYGKQHSEDTKDKIRAKAGHWKGRNHTEETKNKMRKSKPDHFRSPKGKIWWKKGDDEILCKDCPGDGWVRGRTRSNGAEKGRFWWNNGIRSTLSKDCPGGGWVRGRLPKKGISNE